MAAKYPEGEDADGKLYLENEDPDRPPEVNTQVLEDSVSDAKEKDHCLKASQVATVYRRSCSEGGNNNTLGTQDVKDSNFAKLSLLSTSICQDVMREIIRMKNPKGPTDVDLHNLINDSEIMRKKVNKNTSEEILLFPPEGATVMYKQLDFSAMYKVARYALSEQIAKKEKWTPSPKPEAKNLMSCIEELRQFRNSCSHSPSTSIDSTDFQTQVDHVTKVIVRIERLLKIPNKYSMRVERLMKVSRSQAPMSPGVIELEEKSVKLEKEIDQLKKDAEAKQTGMKGLFGEWKQHHEELLDVQRKLEELYKDTKLSPDPEEFVPPLQRNLNDINDYSRKEKLEESQQFEEYFVETKGTQAAMKTLTENHMVIIAGRKGNGKELLSHHLLFSLMSKSECRTHILDSIHDVRDKFKTRSHNTVIVLLHDILIDKDTKSRLKKLASDIFKKKSNNYLIITSANTKHLAGLNHLVNLSAREFRLSTDEKRSILRSHLDRNSKEAFVSTARLNEKQISEIVDIDCSLEFPLACFLFTSDEKYYSKGSNFFRYPIDYFLGELRSLTGTEDSGYMLFFECLLQRGELSHLSFEDSGAAFEHQDINERMEAANLDISDLAEIGESLSLQGTLVQRTPHGPETFSFSNETVERAAQILLLERNFKKALELFNSGLLVRCIATNPRLEKMGLFMVNSSHHTSIAEKLLNDIFAKSVKESIWSSAAIWEDKDFAEIFACILFEKTKIYPDRRRDTVRSILRKCALNGLVVLCQAVVHQCSRQTSNFADDFKRIISQTLLDACQVRGNLAIVHVLTEYKADLSFCQKCQKESEGKHQCPLECAIESNDQEVVHFLLQSGSIIPHSKWKFWDFLRVAATKQDTFICNIPFLRTLSKFWRNRGTTVNSKMEEFIERSLKRDPSRELDRIHFFFDCVLLIGLDDSLYFAFRETLFHGKKLAKDDKCKKSCHKVLESSLDPEIELRTLSVLANKEFDMLNEKDNDGYTPLMKAVMLGKSNSMLLQMLLQNANADERDPNGKTALHLAILSSHPDDWVLNFVNTLAGPKIKCKDIMTATPIRLCMSKGRHRIKTLRRLLEKLQKEDALPKSLVHDCMEESLSEEEMLEIMSVLKEFGSDVNAADSTQVKPIAKAAKCLYRKIVNKLMQWNVGVEDIDSQKNTILHYCCFLDEKSGEELLDAYNRHYSTNATALNKKNDKGRNALMTYLAEPDNHHISSRIVWRFMNMEPDLLIKDVEGNTCLHYLMHSMLTDEEVLDFTQVMVNDFQLSVSICNACGLSPLILAFTASKSRFKTVKFLLSVCDELPLQAGQVGILQSCISSCMTDDEVHELSQMLVSQQGISTNKADITGMSPLFTSIQHPLPRCKTIALMLKKSTGRLCTGVMSELIKHDKLDPDVVDAMHRANIPILTDTFGLSVFHFLIEEASHFPTFHDLVVSFLQFGHDINDVNTEGLSPLFHACREEYPGSIVSSLVSNGARGHIPGKRESALHLCVRSKRNDEETRDIVLDLVHNSSVDVNVVDGYHTTALAAAVCQQKFQTVKVLLENGADPNIPDRENMIALHHSVAGNWSDQTACTFLRLLLPQSKINWQDGNERTALDIAACNISFSRIFSIILLLSSGCEIKRVDRLGRSPLNNTVRYLTGNSVRCQLERLCRMDIFLNFGLSPICEDDEKETAVSVCIKANMEEEIKLLNQNKLELETCKVMMSMVGADEIISDPLSIKFTEDIGVNLFSDEKYQFLREVASRLHQVDLSMC